MSAPQRRGYSPTHTSNTNLEKGRKMFNGVLLFLDVIIILVDVVSIVKEINRSLLDGLLERKRVEIRLQDSDIGGESL